MTTLTKGYKKSLYMVTDLGQLTFTVFTQMS